MPRPWEWRRIRTRTGTRKRGYTIMYWQARPANLYLRWRFHRPPDRRTQQSDHTTAHRTADDAPPAATGHRRLPIIPTYDHTTITVLRRNRRNSSLTRFRSAHRGHTPDGRRRMEEVPKRPARRPCAQAGHQANEHRNRTPHPAGNVISISHVPPLTQEK